ncbi:unnamed protein product [Scytosiphon promiscuus]
MRSASIFVILCSVFSVSLSSESKEPQMEEFVVPDQPSYLVVASRQRSSSSTLSRVFASHPCALHGNEIFAEDPKQDHLGAHAVVDMSQREIYEDPHQYLTRAQEALCAQAVSDGTIPDVCNGQCTIVIKLLDIFGLPPAGIAALMEERRMEFVVLERDIEGEYCSYARAMSQGDWGTTPGQHKASLPDVPCDVVPREFTDKHEDWFAELRLQLRRSSRSFVDVPFALVASCGLKSLAEVVFAMFGFPLPIDIDFPYDIQKLFDACL